MPGGYRTGSIVCSLDMEYGEKQPYTQVWSLFLFIYDLFTPEGKRR